MTFFFPAGARAHRPIQVFCSEVWEEIQDITQPTVHGISWSLESCLEVIQVPNSNQSLPTSTLPSLTPKETLPRTNFQLWDPLSLRRDRRHQIQTSPPHSFSYMTLSGGRGQWRLKFENGEFITLCFLNSGSVPSNHIKSRSLRKHCVHPHR